MKNRMGFSFVAVLFLLPLFVAGAAPKYLFLLIGDGMGENSVKLYRSQFDKTNFDRLGKPARTGTNNVFGKTTDSAASGTALACGIKTYDGAMSVDKDGKPVWSLAKILRDRGVKIGIISSVGINDATPGTHYANRTSRRDSAGSLSDLFVSGFDFFGVSFIHRPPEMSNDDLEFMLKRNNFTLSRGKELANLKKENKNFFVSPTNVSGKNGVYVPSPSLADVTSKAIELLDNPKGFFIMVEGGAIDGSNHRNESAVMIRELAEFDKVIGVVLDFASKHPQDTLVVVTADHETGGLTLRGTAPRGFWKKQSAAHGKINSDLKAMLKKKKSKAELIAHTCKMVGIAVPEGEAAKRINAAAERFMSGKKTEKGSMYGKYNPLVIAVYNEFDRQNNIKYTTFNHTSSKVLTFAYGNGASLFVEPIENSDIPRRISKAATGEDLLEKYKNTLPFPNVPSKEHFALQSIDCSKLVIRFNMADKKSAKFLLKGNGKTYEKVIDAPFGRVTFDGLAPDTEYTVVSGAKEMKVRTLPKLEKVLLKGAVLADPHTSTNPDNPRQRLHSRSGEILKNICKELAASKTDVLLVPGDVTDKSRPGELKLFKSIFKKAPFKLILTRGNHDYPTDKNSAAFKSFFKNAASYCDINGIQIVTLNTGNGKLNNPENKAVLDKLDISRPAIIQSHFQLVKSDIIIKDKNAAVSDADTPGAKAMLDKIAKSRSVVFVGHKNSAERVKIGKNVWQINAPQTTQYPNGYLKFCANAEGIAFSFVPSTCVYIEEFGRRLAPHGSREKFAFQYWNSFIKWPEPAK